MNRTLIIAEIGVNHNADYGLALKMIREAASSGADVIKFQTAISELVQTSSAPMADYQVANIGRSESQLEMSRRLHFPHHVFPALKLEVEKYDKRFMSSAFDLKSLDYLASMGETVFKIPSGEVTNLPYLRSVGGKASKVLLSTGMATMEEIANAVNVLLSCGLKKHQIIVLQCNTDYPTPLVDVNLKAMVNMGKALGLNYGCSDHTLGIEVPIAAVALGAKVIEKHFTIDCSLPGPDQRASLEPRLFSEMVRCIRNIEIAMGSDEKKPTPSEVKNKKIARRSIYTASSIAAGETLTMENLVVLRPEAGLSPMEIDRLIGKTAIRDLPAEYAVTLDDIK